MSTLGAAAFRRVLAQNTALTELVLSTLQGVIGRRKHTHRRKRHGASGARLGTQPHSVGPRPRYMPLLRAVDKVELGDAGAQMLLRALGKVTALAQLYLSIDCGVQLWIGSNNITIKGIRDLATAKALKHSLNSLYLGRENIGWV